MTDTTAKLTRTNELLAARSLGWTNAQFWEAHSLLSAISNDEMGDEVTFRNLMVAWGDEEERRIDNGEHEGCSPELQAQLRAK